MIKIIQQTGTVIYRLLLRLETAALVTLLLSMIIISVLQIGLRNGLNSGILWADDYLRVVVLWLTFIGAMVASRQGGKHIAIDIIYRSLKPSIQIKVKRLTNMITAIICFIAVYYSVGFVKMDYEYSEQAFASVPTWVCEMIIPLGFLVIGLRYLFSSIIGSRHSL